MKYEYETCDIQGGIRFGVSGSKETFMVGYDASQDSEYQWCIISLIDGSIIKKDMNKALVMLFINKQVGVHPIYIKD